MDIQSLSIGFEELQTFVELFHEFEMLPRVAAEKKSDGPARGYVVTMT